MTAGLMTAALYRGIFFSCDGHFDRLNDRKLNDRKLNDRDFSAMPLVSRASTTAGLCGSSCAGHGVVHVVQANVSETER
jgi:hypothetical protein